MKVPGSLPLALAALTLASPSQAQCTSAFERLNATPGSIGQGFYGQQMDLDDEGDTLVIANHGDETDGLFSGAVHVWRYNGLGWDEEPLLSPPGNGPDDGFGQDAALDGFGNTLIVGEYNLYRGSPGQAYVYEFDGTSWVEQTRLVPADSAQFFAFGRRCDLDASGTVAVLSGGNGGVYVFRGSGSSWNEEQKFDTGGGFIEAVISADGLTLAYADQVARFDGSQWVSAGTLVANDGEPVAAAAIDADGDTVLAAQATAASDQGPYVFRETQAGWMQEQKLQATPDILDRFGGNLALDPQAAVVFATGRQASLDSVVTAYRFDGTTWSNAEQYAHVNAGDDLSRGIVTSADASTFVIGSPAMGPGNATAYAFRCTSPRTFCYGSACPCGNDGLPAHGCRSPGSTSGVRLATTSFAPDGAGGGTVDLAATGFPSDGTPAAVVLRSTAQDLNGSPMFDGLSCLQGAPTRIRVAFAIDGRAAFPVAHGAGAGEFHYQVLYRALPSTACPTSSSANLSNGLTLIWP